MNFEITEAWLFDQADKLSKIGICETILKLDPNYTTLTLDKELTKRMQMGFISPTNYSKQTRFHFNILGFNLEIKTQYDNN